MRKTSLVKSCAILLLSVLSVGSLHAQYAPKDPRDVKGALTASYVKTGLFVIAGGGGNTVLRLSGNGLILVNGKDAEHYDELTRRVRKIVDQPIRIEINTDHYAGHNGTNARFAADNIEVVVQENAAHRLQIGESTPSKPSPKFWTYHDQKTLHFGPVEVQLLHFGSAHTDGDTVVFFPDLQAIAIGRLYSINPVPDYSAGGSLVGWRDALTDLLKLDFTVAIPDDGPAVSRAGVENLESRLNILISRGAAMVKNGLSKESLFARMDSGELGMKLDLNREQLAAVYGELATAK